MDTFNKKLFNNDGQYTTYGQDRLFVARFRIRGDRSSFLTFLTRNFTPTEYFARLQGGEAPLTILESKGYVFPRLAKLAAAAGFAPTLEGFHQYVKAQVEARAAARG